MKHLFIARHGHYNENYRINEFGRLQMKLLGKVIKQILNNGSAYLISSTAPRALDSSQVLIEQLGLPPEFEQIPYIWSGIDSPLDSFSYDPDFNKLINMVEERKDRADGLVIVTHVEITNSLPSQFIRAKFRQNESVGEIAKGQAVHLDIEQKRYQVLPR